MRSCLQSSCASMRKYAQVCAAFADTCPPCLLPACSPPQLGRAAGVSALPPLPANSCALVNVHSFLIFLPVQQVHGVRPSLPSGGPLRGETCAPAPVSLVMARRPICACKDWHCVLKVWRVAARASSSSAPACICRDYANYSQTLQKINATQTDIGGEFSSLGVRQRFGLPGWLAMHLLP